MMFAIKCYHPGVGVAYAAKNGDGVSMTDKPIRLTVRRLTAWLQRNRERYEGKHWEIQVEEFSA